MPVVPLAAVAVVVIRHRKTGEGLRYTVVESSLRRLGEINATIQDPLARYSAVMNAPTCSPLRRSPNSARRALSGGLTDP